VSRIGSLLDVSRLASELGINRPKIYSYLKFLQGIFIIRLLPRYAEGIDRSVAGGKKVYFSDTGLLSIMGQINNSQIFENAVVNQLAKYVEISFYNKRNTAEIDVVLNKKLTFEVKLTGSEKDYLKLNKLSAELKISNAGYVISKKFIEKKGFISSTIL